MLRGAAPIATHAAAWRRGLGAAAIAAGALAPVPDAAALWDDRLELFVAETVTRDDNVFRISSGVDPAVALGSPAKGDTYSTTSLGFSLDVPVSRQRLQARFAWNITRYDRFTVLNLDDGRDARAAWLWQLGNDLGGQLGVTDTLALASLANARSGVLSGTPNVLNTRRGFANAEYRWTPRWRLRGEASRLRQSNEVPVLQVNDVVIEGAELGVGYFTPAGNQAGFSVAVEEGRFPNRQPVAGDLIDNGYVQRRATAFGDWTFSGQSRAGLRAGLVSRHHEQLPQRDFEHATFRADYNWSPSAKFSVSAVAQRDVSPLDDLYSRSVLLKSVALRPLLRLTEKTSLSGLLEYSERDYRTSPEIVLGAVPPRTDRVRGVGVTATYHPARAVTLELALRRETRSSSAAFGDYEVNIASVGVRVGF